jgi:hypothetical protein
MSNRFSSAKHAIAECDRCGFRYKLKELKPLTIKNNVVNIFVCPTCWEKDQPQLSLGLYPVEDPQAIRNPRPDLTRFPSSKSRNFQYGFNPVGFADPLELGLQNNLVASTDVGNVTIEIS